MPPKFKTRDTPVEKKTEVGQYLADIVKEFIENPKIDPPTQQFIRLEFPGTGGTRESSAFSEYLNFQITPSRTIITMQVDAEYFTLDDGNKKQYIEENLNEFFEDEPAELLRELDVVADKKKAYARKDISEFLKAAVAERKKKNPGKLSTQEPTKTTPQKIVRE
jgi:hypothetical protein